MSRKQRLTIAERAACEAKLKKILLKLIRYSGLIAAECQVKYLADHPELDLPTIMNHRETVRQYELIIKDYKNEYSKSKFESDQISIDS